MTLKDMEQREYFKCGDNCMCSCHASTGIYCESCRADDGETVSVSDIKADIIKTCKELKKKWLELGDKLTKEKPGTISDTPILMVQLKSRWEALMKWAGVTEDELK